MRFMQAMHRKKLCFINFQIHETCFLLNCLWVCELFEAVLIHFHSLGSSAHLLLMRIKHSFRVKHSFSMVSFHFIFSVLLLFDLLASFSLDSYGSLPCTVSLRNSTDVAFCESVSVKHRLWTIVFAMQLST